MAYGFEVYNAQGEEVMEYQNTLYITSSGTTIKDSEYATQANADADAKGVGTGFGQRRGLVGWDPPLHGNIPERQYVTTGGRCAVIDNRGILLPEFILNAGDMVFYRADHNPLIHSTTFLWDLPGTSNGGYARCMTANGNKNDFLIASAQQPSGLSGNYGMQVFKGNGDVAFDSRADNLSIFQVIHITKSQVENILHNDDTINVSLNKSAPSCYIGIPFFSAFAVYNSPDEDRFVRVYQTSNTNIRIDQRSYNRGGFDPNARAFEQDMFIFVARNPFI